MKLPALFITTLWQLVLAKAPVHYQDLPHSIEDNYVVVLRKNATPADVHKHFGHIKAQSKLLATQHQGVLQTYENANGFNAYSIECPGSMLEEIRQHNLVDYVAQDGKIQVQSPIPGTAVIARQASQFQPWGLGRISHRKPGIPTYADVGLKVGITDGTWIYGIDTGIRTTHQEFGGRASWGANFVDGSPVRHTSRSTTRRLDAHNLQNTDQNGHGTHTAATAGGDTVGVNNSTHIIAVKCLDANASGTWSGCIAAVNWAVNDAMNKSRVDKSVINMSFGGSTFQPMDDIIAFANNEGVTTAVAASNYGQDACGYSPARAGGTSITVAAIDENDTRPGWSNFGDCVNIFAPGWAVVSAWADSDTSYATLYGTSMATPHIAGLASYLMSREGLSGPVSVHSRMMDLATYNMVQNANTTSNLIAYNGGDSPE